MANGSIAAGLGWTTYPSTQAHSLGYDDINYSLDRAAQEVIDRGTAVAAAIARTPKINVSSTPMTSGTAVDGDLRFW